MDQKIKRIAINTGGGDAPGLNAVIRAVVLAAINLGWECYGILDSYNGLLKPEQYPSGGLIRLTRDSIRGITHVGGTILGTTNKGNPLKYPTRAGDGQIYEKDRSDEVIEALKTHRIEALIAIGGDGSMFIANALAQPHRRRRTGVNYQWVRPEFQEIRTNQGGFGGIPPAPPSLS